MTTTVCGMFPVLPRNNYRIEGRCVGDANGFRRYTWKMTGSSIVAGGMPNDQNITIFLIQLVIVVALSRTLAWLFGFLKQPSVIAEVVAGILLGPSAFGESSMSKRSLTIEGRIDGYVTNIFPPTKSNSSVCGYIPRNGKNILAPYGPIDVLSVFANFGLILFMFLIGLELDTSIMKRNLKQGLSISLAGIALPFAFGAAIAYPIFTTVGTPPNPNVQFSTFLVFVCVAMSITAFPVLARILSETGLMETRIGNLALSAAAVDDVIAWILLAVVVGIANASTPLAALYTFLLLISFVAFMILIVKPVLAALAKSRYLLTDSGELSLNVLAIFLLGIFICAWWTQVIGVDVIFGGFVMGIATPRSNRLPERFMKSIEDVVVVLLLPLYFANSGLKTNIGSLSHGTSWGIVALVITAACCGKIWAAVFTAKLVAKTTWKESWTIGFLMNTKGLVELIVLNVGLSSGILNTETFTIFVLMALITTFITTPVVHFLYLRDRKKKRRNLNENYMTSIAVRNVSVVAWATEVLPKILGREKMTMKIFVLKEINDRPSTYMSNEFVNLLESLRLKKRDEKTNLITKVAEKHEINAKILATARINADLTEKWKHRNYDVVFTEIHIDTKSTDESDLLVQSSSLADHMIHHYTRPLGIIIHGSDVKIPCRSILFLYEGTPAEEFALDFVKNLAGSGSDIRLTCIVKTGVDFKLPEREGDEIITVDHPFGNHASREEDTDLIVFGGDRQSSGNFRTAVRNCRGCPYLVLFPSGSSAEDNSGVFSVKKSELEDTPERIVQVETDALELHERDATPSIV
ncbi:hypothetical protein PROFUN_05225 [Planoprotostelium fungivorum]|uniref:Cation/H+ exchanger transmembrane domain-containing protein n=1 Tax=Planoprotostelium fungivorum TaxID=1890364 RepID=A0A2P6NRK3_9EUKA|nr:hypothetical protein PROFUN_05225 [Planoprotostelium fungivorum]